MSNVPSDFGDNVYLRVMILGCVDAVLTLPLSILLLVLDIKAAPTSFYLGWEEMHAHFSSIPIVTASEWKEDTRSTILIYYYLWVSQMTAFGFFALFGLTKKARTTYRILFWKTMKPFGVKEPPAQDSVISNMRFGLASNTNRVSDISNAL